MYCVNIKRLAWHNHALDGGDQHHLGLRRLLVRISRALKRTGLSVWDYRRFAGLARLSASGFRICVRGEAELGQSKETEISGPKVA